MRKWILATILAFLIPVFAFFFVSLFDVDATRSEDEKRDLATMPTFTLKKFFSGDFTSEFETYYADTFPLREKMLGSSRTINLFYSVSFGDNTTIIVDKTDHGEEGGNSLIDVDPGYSEATTKATTPATTETTEPTSTEPTNVTAEGSTSGTEPTKPGSTTGIIIIPTRPTTTEATEPTVTEPTVTETSATETTPAESSTVITSWIPAEHPNPAETADGGESGDTIGGSILVWDKAVMEHYYAVESSIDTWTGFINKVHRQLPDVQVYAMFCPTSIEFNAPPKYQSGVRSQLQAMNYAYSNLDLGVAPVNVWSEIYPHQDEYVYFRSDHHWTQRGAYYGYRAFCKAAGIAPHELNEYATDRVDDFVGSLYSYVKNYPIGQVLLNNPDYVEFFTPLNSSSMTIYRDASMTNGVSRSSVIASKDYILSLNKKSVKYMMFIWGDNPITHIVSDTVKNGRTLLVTKESYANALVPFLTDHFEEIYVIDPREFNGNGKPSLNVINFAKEHGVTDFLVINYAFAAASNFMNIWNKMLP